MTVFEQNRALDYTKAKFDKEYAFRFTSITNHREIFTAWNVSIDKLAKLIEQAKELIPNQFVIEYHSPYTSEPLFLGPNGLMISPYRFNSKYNPNIKDDVTHILRVDNKTLELIKRFVKETTRQNRFFVQNCLIREFTPNRWVKSRENAKLIKTYPVDKNANSFDVATPEELTPQIRYGVIVELQKNFDFISFNNGIFRFSSHYLPDEFYDYWIEQEFEFEDKSYSNWFDAFLDACVEAEKLLTDIRLPIESNKNSIFKNEERWKPYRVCLQELMDVIELNKKLEKQVSDLKIKTLNATAQTKAKLESDLKNLQAEATTARRKRVELNIRNLRQVNILIKNYMNFFLAKNSNENVSDEVETLQFKFSYLEQLRKDFLKQIKKEQNIVTGSYELHDANVVALNHLGEVVQKGEFQFTMNASFINILYSKNIELFEGVSELVFTLKDGKTIYHYPSYNEQGVARYKMGGVAVKFDENINVWIAGFYQDPQDLVIQACLNQGPKILKEFKKPKKEVW